MLWPLRNTNGRLAIPALAGLLVIFYGRLMLRLRLTKVRETFTRSGP